MDKPTPLINSSMLSQYSGQTVRIVGKVQKVTGNTLLLQTSDLGNVEVALTPDSDISGSKFVEVTGKVSDGGSSLDGNLIREFTTVDCGEGVGTFSSLPTLPVTLHPYSVYWSLSCRACLNRQRKHCGLEER